MNPWINYHHLYYFKAIAEEGTVSKAAWFAGWFNFLLRRRENLWPKRPAGDWRDWAGSRSGNPSSGRD